MLYEFDGAITYCFPRNQKVRDAIRKQITQYREIPQIEQPVGSNVGGIKPTTSICVTPTVELTSKELYRGSMHLIFGRPGQGKSRLATELARQGRLIIFACASNEQAEEQHGNCPYPDKELLVSRAYMLKKDYGIDVAQQSSVDHFEAPEPD